MELVEIAALLDRHRLVTLTGPGGAGKTRLALRTAAEQEPRFPDGIWLVELGRLQNPEGTPAELAAALEVVAVPGQGLLERAVEFLSDRRGLLIMDNCEHLVVAAGDLAQRLTGSCARLSVLATSRESLSIPGEHTYGVGSLGVHGSPDEPSDAARLFADRAQEDRPGFELTDTNRAAVEQICARLDGMPLAMELAAARAQSMGTAEIAARLDERFRLLTGGTRGRVERHQTLRATVEWSYGLLSPAERDLFARLSVFAATFDLDAAVAVGATDRVDDFDVLDHLRSLVAKSMIAADDHPILGTRYRLLETLRAFGQEELDGAGLLDTVRQAHAAHYTTRARPPPPTSTAPMSGSAGGYWPMLPSTGRRRRGW